MTSKNFFRISSALLLLSNFNISPAYAEQNQPLLPEGAEYVAMGSSFASGPGIADVIDKGCGRSSENYANRVARELKLNLRDVTCSGATIAKVVDTPQRNHGGEIVAPQIQALTENTRLVTVTVGGNSFNYSLRTIQAACDATGVFSRAVNKSVLCFMVGQMDTEGFDKELASIDKQLTNMLVKIRATAPQAKIVFVDYTTIFAGNSKECAANQPIDQATVDAFINQADQFSAIIKKVTSKLDVELVQLSKASKSHHVCSDEPWVTGFEYTAEGVIPYHPTADAMNAAAELVLKSLTGTK